MGALQNGPIIFEDLDTTTLTQYLGGGGTSEASTGPRVGFLSVEPASANGGAGVTAPLGSIVSVYTTSIVALYIKTGAAATAWSPIGGAGAGVVMAFSQTVVGAAQAASAAETVLDGTLATIPANTLKVGSVIRFTMAGTVTGVNAADTLRLKLEIGGTGPTFINGSEVLDTTAIQAFALDQYILTGEIVVRTLGANPAFGTWASGGSHAFDAPVALATPIVVGEVATGQFDTTLDMVICGTSLWSGASINNQAINDVFNVQVLDPPAP